MTSLTEDQIARASSLSWYHAFDFGSHQTAGRFREGSPPNMTLFGVMDLLNGIDVRGMKCLEVGPAHGLISIGLAMRGADVTAIDIGSPNKTPQWRLAEAVLGVAVNYVAPVALENVRAYFDPASFDLIVCAGVMYHLLNPSDVFIRLRPLLKRDGLIVVESAHDTKARDPVLVLNSETGQYTEPTTYFLPSVSFMTGFARLACFDVLATRTCAPARFALIGKAVPPDQVSDRTAMCEKIHAFGLTDPAFSFAGLSAAARSAIEYLGPRGHRLVALSEAIDFPPHPQAMNNVIGQAVTVEKLRRLTRKTTDGAPPPEAPDRGEAIPRRTGATGEVRSGEALFGDRPLAAYDLLAHLPPGLMLDVGAAGGALTERMLLRSPKSRVIAFEPFPGNHVHFKKAIGDDSRVTLYRTAVSDKSGRARFSVPQVVQAGRLEGYSSVGFLGEGEGQRFDVDVVALDDIVSEPVRFMKVDIQGGEIACLKGAENLLSEHGVDIIFIEFGGEREILSLLAGHGYTFYDHEYVLIPRGGKQIPADWRVIREGKQTTGVASFNAWPPATRPTEASAYCAWMKIERRKIGSLFTDLVCVSEGFEDRFLAAAEAARN